MLSGGQVYFITNPSITLVHQGDTALRSPSSSVPSQSLPTLPFHLGTPAGGGGGVCEALFEDANAVLPLLAALVAGGRGEARAQGVLQAELGAAALLPGAGALGHQVGQGGQQVLAVGALLQQQHRQLLHKAHLDKRASAFFLLGAQ